MRICSEPKSWLFIAHNSRVSLLRSWGAMSHPSLYFKWTQNWQHKMVLPRAECQFSFMNALGGTPPNHCLTRNSCALCLRLQKHSLRSNQIKTSPLTLSCAARVKWAKIMLSAVNAALDEHVSSWPVMSRGIFHHPVVFQVRKSTGDSCEFQIGQTFTARSTRLILSLKQQQAEKHFFFALPFDGAAGTKAYCFFFILDAIFTPAQYLGRHST